MRRAWICAAMLVLLVAGCASGHASPAASSASSAGSPAASGSATPSPSQHGTSWSVVALGDSVPSGSQCDCTPYPQLSAADMSIPGKRDITANNLAVDGYTTDDVLSQLTIDVDVIKAVQNADAVEIEIGANDVGYSRRCGNDANCYESTVPDVQKNLRTIVDRVNELAAGHLVAVTLLDYWSVWLGGQYAQDQGQDYVNAAAQVTDDINAAIKTVASDTGSLYVDLRAAFKGPDYTADETQYLAADGDHPNAAGHQQIALALEQVVETALHLPPS